MGKTSITFSDDHQNQKPVVSQEFGFRNDFDEEEADRSKEENVNNFVQKKTLSQGFLDVALLAVNAAQLKRIMSAGSEHNNYTIMITLISISFALQAVQVVLMTIMGIFLDLNIKRSHPKQIIANNLLLTSTAFCVGVNVLLSAFDIAETK